MRTTSTTVSESGSRVSCNAMPIFARTRTSVGLPPRTTTSPPSFGVSPSRISIVVVLPAPFGPSMPKHSPRLTSRSTPFTEGTSGYFLTRFLHDSAMPASLASNMCRSSRTPRTVKRFGALARCHPGRGRQAPHHPGLPPVGIPPFACRPKATRERHGRVTFGRHANGSMTYARANVATAIPLGRFLLDDVVGSGGAGVVFRARHTRLDLPVAVKVLPPKADRLALHAHKNEVQAVARLHHPHVVAILDAGTVDGAAAQASEKAGHAIAEGSPYLVVE